MDGDGCCLPMTATLLCPEILHPWRRISLLYSPNTYPARYRSEVRHAQVWMFLKTVNLCATQMQGAPIYWYTRLHLCAKVTPSLFFRLNALHLSYQKHHLQGADQKQTEALSMPMTQQMLLFRLAISPISTAMVSVALWLFTAATCQSHIRGCTHALLEIVAERSGYLHFQTASTPI